jgi:hypothetical protein
MRRLPNYRIGNDGSWSSFAFRVGNPAQFVKLLISTSTSETNVLLPEACQDGEYGSNCEDSRGLAFNINQSTTWEANAPADPTNPYFGLRIEERLNMSGFGQ